MCQARSHTPCSLAGDTCISPHIRRTPLPGRGTQLVSPWWGSNPQPDSFTRPALSIELQERLEIPLGIIHGQKYVMARRMTRAGLLGSIETRHLHGLRRHLSGLPSSLHVHGLSQLLPLVSIESWLRRRDLNPRSSGYEPDEMTTSLLHYLGAPTKSRTPDISITNAALYQLSYKGIMVRMTGIEPTTSCSQSKCSTELSYTLRTTTTSASANIWSATRNSSSGMLVLPSPTTTLTTPACISPRAQRAQGGCVT